MLLVEPIEKINEWLKRDYGCPFDDRPKWRVVMAGEQIEKRWVNTLPDGIVLAHPVVQEVKKYQHIKPNFYVLEQLTPIIGESDLIEKTSYEPLWTFEDRHGNYLPPQYSVCRIVIGTVMNQMEHANGVAKYVDDSLTPEKQAEKLDQIEKDLFGNETPVGDALAYGYGVAGFHSKMEKQ